MGVSFIGAGAATAQADPSTATIALPAGTGLGGPGDYMLLVATVRGTGWTPNTPSGGWALLDSHTNTTSNLNRVYIFGKAFAQEQAGVSLSWSGSGANQTAISQILLFGGVNDSTPVEVAGTWTDSGSVSQNIGAITATSSTNADAMAVAITHKADDWTSVAPDGSWLEASEADTTSGNDAGISLSYKKIASAASSSTYTPVVTGGSTAHWTGIILILGARTGTITSSEDFELGSNGNTIVPNSATSAPELSINSGGGSAVFSNANPHLGTMGGLINPTAGSHRIKFNNKIPGPIMYVRAYLYITDTTPASAIRIMECEDYPGTPVGSIALSPAGLIRVQTSGGSNVVNSSTTMAANTMYRLELCCNVTANTTTARIYTGADLDSFDTDYTDTCQTSVTGSVPWVERCLVGCGTTNATNIYVDEFAYSTDDWVGPALDVVPSIGVFGVPMSV